MSWPMAFFTFLNVWWVVLLMVLPWGVRRPERIEPGHAVGAPQAVNFRKKFLVTTALAVVITAALALFIKSGIMTFE